MPTPTKAVKANPVSGALIDPPVATFCSANGIAQLSDLTSFFDYKGGQNCSTNPNYPAALKGDVYSVTVAGKIGGASGVVVAVGDTFLATADNAGGTQAAVGSSWIVSQANIDLGNIAITGGTITGTTVSGLTVSPTTGTLTIENLALVEFQQQVQTIGTFYAGGNVYIYGSFTTDGDVIFSGAYSTTFTITANTSVTFPTSGTLLSTAAIGVSVQAYDADLTTWAGITPAAGVGQFLATPSGANLASALTSALPVSKGGTGVTTSGTTSEIPVGGGTGSAIVWTTATGTGAPVRAIAPAFTGSPTISGNTASPNGTITTIGDQLWSLHRVRQIGAFLFGNTGTSSNGSETGARGGANVHSGSSTSGYGRATIAQAFNQTSSSGGGIRFNYPISVAVLAGIHAGAATTSKVRLVVGANGGVPATADANALAVVGFGVEFQYYASEQVECRLFAHNGTTYVTSAWSGAVAGGLNRMTAFIVTSDGAGNISLYLSSATSAAGRPSSTALLTLAGGPTTQGNTTNNRIDFIATNDSTGSPSPSIATLFSALLDTP